MTLSAHGVGLRLPHVAQILESGLKVGWVEALTENHLGRGGRAAAVLERVRQDSRLVFHGVSLSVGGTSPFSERYLRGLQELMERYQPEWIGDHFCFSGYGGAHGHDLWPLPFTEESATHLVQRISQVQERLGCRLVLENISSYIEHASSEMAEHEWISHIARAADCELLVDVNNVYVSAHNHGFDPLVYLQGLPSERIRQLHLAGHQDLRDYLFDTHDGPVSDAVWDLYRACIRIHGPKPTVIEWDEHIPSLERLVAESELARQVESAVLLEQSEVAHA